MKKNIFAANWKLNKSPKESREFFNQFLELRSSSENETSTCVFFTPSTNLESTSDALKGSGVLFGAQNCFSLEEGAYTGETSARVVKELGGTFVLLGHSERRKIFGETDEMIAPKGKLVQKLGLIPMICIGETLEERESGLTQKVCETQLTSFMNQIDLSKEWVVAYEPVWAIGTGKVATVAQVAETHSSIREFITQKGGSKDVPLLYGGSVKPENSKELLNIPNVNGFLVGGASLDPLIFSKICLK